jgi:hypothetical protein
MAENYAIKSITLVDFIDVRDIASGVPFWPGGTKAVNYLISTTCVALHTEEEGGIVHFIAVFANNCRKDLGYNNEFSCAGKPAGSPSGRGLEFIDLLDDEPPCRLSCAAVRQPNDKWLLPGESP